MTTELTLRARFQAARIVPECPIYDLHGHWGATPGIALPAADEATAHRLLAQSGVRRLVISHHDALFAPEIGNAATIAAVRRLPHTLRGYCAVNPNYPALMARDLAEYDDYPDVYVGIKMLADYHGIALDDDRYRPAWEMADARRLLVLAHTWGGSSCNGYPALCAVLERYPHVPLLLGHCLYDDWTHAIALARDYPNAYLELTAVLSAPGVLERFVAEVGSTRVVFGTDFPWFSFPCYLGATLGAAISDDDRHNILHRNAQRLLGEEG